MRGQIVKGLMLNNHFKDIKVEDRMEELPIAYHRQGPCHIWVYVVTWVLRMYFRQAVVRALGDIQSIYIRVVSKASLRVMHCALLMRSLLVQFQTLFQIVSGSGFFVVFFYFARHSKW